MNGSSSAETDGNDDGEEGALLLLLLLYVLCLLFTFSIQCEVKDTQRWTVEENGFQ